MFQSPRLIGPENDANERNYRQVHLSLYHNFAIGVYLSDHAKYMTMYADKAHELQQCNFHRPQTKLQKGNVFTRGCTSPRQRPPRMTPPLDRHPQDGHCGGRYASYWNTFLLAVPEINFQEISHFSEKNSKYFMHTIQQ